MPKILFVMFLSFNFLMAVSYIPFVKAILGSFEFIFLNRQFFLSMFLRVFQPLLRIPVNVSQWRMEIRIFNNSISNSLHDYVFYLSKRLVVITYLLHALLLKYIVNSTLLLIFTQDVVFIGIFYFHSCQISGIASVYYS